jgi:hypothetical protein
MSWFWQPEHLIHPRDFNDVRHTDRSLAAVEVVHELALHASRLLPSPIHHSGLINNACIMSKSLSIRAGNRTKVLVFPLDIFLFVLTLHRLQSEHSHCEHLFGVSSSCSLVVWLL